MIWISPRVAYNDAKSTSRVSRNVKFEFSDPIYHGYGRRDGLRIV